MNPRTLLLTTCAASLATLIGLSPLPALADCTAWQLLPKFNAVQENGYTVVFDVQNERDGTVWGSAYYLTGDDLHRVEGDVSGSFDGNVLKIGVQWQDDTLGDYEGYVEGGGSLAGVTRNLSEYASQPVRWRSKQRFKCAPPAPPVVDSIDKPPDYVDPGTPLGIVKKPNGLGGLMQVQ